MSRARPICLPDGEVLWFDMKRNGVQATGKQLELLCAITGDELDDLLDADVTQGSLIRHLREALDQGCIPEEVIARQAANREIRRHSPECRACGVPGNSTRHHFVNRWIMKVLSNYEEVAPRPKCTVPICIDCHRDLHDRSGPAVSMVPYLKASERRMARDLLERLRRERPAIFTLLAEGDGNVYETRLVHDWLGGYFDR